MKKIKDRLKATLERTETKIHDILLSGKTVPNTLWSRYDKYVTQYNKLCPQNTTYQIETYGGKSKHEHTN